MPRKASSSWPRGVTCKAKKHKLIEIPIYSSITVAILGIAYPILLQVYARLDEKYSSDRVVELFEKEGERKWFKYSLIGSLLAIFIYTMNLEPRVHIELLKPVVYNSAKILVILTTWALVISFFLFVEKIIAYYRLSRFTQYLIQKHNKAEDTAQYFEGLIDIFFHSIKTQNHNITRTISRFFYSAFQKEREKNTEKEVEYPDVYYDLVYKAIEELALQNERRNYSAEKRTAGGIWLLGESKGSHISQKTYTWLWHNLKLVVENRHDDMILDHWQTAHQYIKFNLSWIPDEIEFIDGKNVVKNEHEVKARESQRQKFLEFHFALGGLLLYSNMFEAIKRCFNFTTSAPPQYELLPNSMSEVFSWFNKFRDPYEMNYSWISHQYSFPKLEGVNSDYEIKDAICSYVALLFLRQYTLQSYSVLMEPMQFPPAPENQSEIKKWAEGLRKFKSQVQAHLDNKELLTVLGFDIITQEWCQIRKIPSPIDFIDQLESRLKDKYESNAMIIPLSEEKKQKFNDSSKESLQKTFSRLKLVSNAKSNFEGESKDWYIHGESMIQSRDTFAENSEVAHLNYDSFLGSSLSSKAFSGLASTFLINSTKTFLLRDDDILKVMDKLNQNENLVFVNFGMNLSWFAQKHSVEGLSESDYKGTQIISFPGSHVFQQPTLFVLTKQDLPLIKFLPIKADLKEKYESTIEEIEGEFQIFSSVLEFSNATEDIIQENIAHKDRTELMKAILLSILFLVQIRWKQRISMIRIIEYSEYDQKGLPNTIEDVDF